MTLESHNILATQRAESTRREEALSLRNAPKELKELSVKKSLGAASGQPEKPITSGRVVTKSGVSSSESARSFKLDKSVLLPVGFFGLGESSLSSLTDEELDWAGKHMAYALSYYPDVQARGEEKYGKDSATFVQGVFRVNKKYRDGLLNRMDRYFDESTDSHRTKLTKSQVNELVKIIAAFPKESRAQMAEEVKAERLSMVVEKQRIEKIVHGQANHDLRILQSVSLEKDTSSAFTTDESSDGSRSNSPLTVSQRSTLVTWLKAQNLTRDKSYYLSEARLPQTMLSVQNYFDSNRDMGMDNIPVTEDLVRGLFEEAFAVSPVPFEDEGRAGHSASALLQASDLGKREEEPTVEGRRAWAKGHLREIIKERNINCDSFATRTDASKSTVGIMADMIRLASDHSDVDVNKCSVSQDAVQELLSEIFVEQETWAKDQLIRIVDAHKLTAASIDTKEGKKKLFSSLMDAANDRNDSSVGRHYPSERTTKRLLREIFQEKEDRAIRSAQEAKDQQKEWNWAFLNRDT